MFWSQNRDKRRNRVIELKRRWRQNVVDAFKDPRLCNIHQQSPACQRAPHQLKWSSTFTSAGGSTGPHVSTEACSYGNLPFVMSQMALVFLWYPLPGLWQGPPNMLKVQQRISFIKRTKVSILAANRGLNMLFSIIININI